MLMNRLAGTRFSMPVSSGKICYERIGFTLGERLISMLRLTPQAYRLYFFLCKWQKGEESVIIGEETISSWGFERHEFYRTLKDLAVPREELMGEALLTFERDLNPPDLWRIRVNQIHDIMDRMSKKIGEENGIS